MKIVVIGAGAMGCLYGAALSKKNEVIMIDSFSKQVDAINKDGIKVINIDESVSEYKNIKAYMSGEYTESVDLVILFVKSTYTQEALEANKKLFSPSTLVMTLQNGAGNDRKIANYVEKENIIIGTSTHNAVNKGMGTTKHTAYGLTTIGSNYGQKDKLKKLDDLFNEIGFDLVVSDDIQRLIWSKLFVNLSINTFTALIQTNIGYMAKNKAAWDFAKRLVYEAVEVAEADGTYFDRREALESVRQVCIKAGDGYSSMYQDRKNKVRTEIDAINGSIVEQAKLYGVPTPYNAIIVDLIHAVEGSYDLEN